MPAVIVIDLYYFRYACTTACSPHWMTHIEANICDVSDLEKLKENQCSKSLDFSKQTNQTRTARWICGNKETVRLYSTRSFDELSQFVKDRYGKPEDDFSVSEDKYNLLCNNCADAIQGLLDFCFPTTCAIQTYALYQWLCCLPALASLGLLTCFPMTPCITTPRDVFNRATLLKSSGKAELPQDVMLALTPQLEDKFKKNQSEEWENRYAKKGLH